MMAVMARMFHQISQHLRCEARALFARHGANFTCHEERDTWGSIASHQGSLSLSLCMFYIFVSFHYIVEFAKMDPYSSRGPLSTGHSAHNAPRT